MSVSQKRILAVVAIIAALALLGFLAFRIISNPENSFMKLFRGNFSSGKAKVIFGPYPIKADIFHLKQSGVTTIISLLNPSLPYERKLIEEEKKNAARFQVDFKNIPMNPIPIMLGHKNEANIKQSDVIVAAALKAPGKVYIHCYLGLHRVGEVKTKLENMKQTTATYLGRKGERSDRAKRLDDAQKSFNAGDYKTVVRALEGEAAPDLREVALLAWSHYRLGNMVKAKALFTRALALSPGNADANDGLGYSALRQGDLAAAQKAFNAAIRSKPDDASAYTGLGLTYQRKGQTKEAASALKKALEIDPANTDAQDTLNKIPENSR